LSQSASMEFGNGGGGVRQAMAEFYGGLLFIVEAGSGAHLAVLTSEEADPGLIGHNMNELVEQLSEHLTTPPRQATAASCTAPPVARAPTASTSSPEDAAQERTTRSTL